ncbi:histidine-containing phosphotransfer protein 5-like [Cryptomeria japonica]|uniref:histidine-containing phosphotransfer protein 5-like n=1 Tax=Cryptomeria japonica TaxID=3369 RepID=UPI0027DA0A37|nr:histidine-containing phosphotransfer protein 5-like [Cryptomeria japonica]
MATVELQQQYNNLINFLYEEGFLDEQYSHLEQLQDKSNPNFVEEVFSLFFDNSLKLLHSLETILDKEPVDYRKVECCLHHLKGSSPRHAVAGIDRFYWISLMALVTVLAVSATSEAGNYLLKDKLQDLFQIEEQRGGGTISVIN